MNSLPHEQVTCARTYSGWMSAFIVRARIAEAISALTMPPETTVTTFPPRFPVRTAAVAAAPPGSTASLARLYRNRKPFAISASETSTTGRRGPCRPRAGASAAKGAVSPSATVFGVIGTGRPRRARAPARSTPPARPRRPGLRGNAGSRDPETRPPPPQATTTVSTSGDVREDLEPDRPGARHHDGIVERMHDTRPVSSSAPAAARKPCPAREPRVDGRPRSLAWPRSSRCSLPAT